MAPYVLFKVDLEGRGTLRWSFPWHQKAWAAIGGTSMMKSSAARSLMLGDSLGQIDALTFIQSNFGDLGSFELVARAGEKLAFFWLECGLDLRWNGSCFSILFE